MKHNCADFDCTLQSPHAHIHTSDEGEWSFLAVRDDWYTWPTIGFKYRRQAAREAKRILRRDKKRRLVVTV